MMRRSRHDDRSRGWVRQPWRRWAVHHAMSGACAPVANPSCVVRPRETRCRARGGVSFPQVTPHPASPAAPVAGAWDDPRGRPLGRAWLRVEIRP